MYIISKQPFPKAKTAVGATDFRNEQQRRGRVFMLTAWRYIVDALIRGIETPIFVELRFAWNREFANGIIGIIPMDQSLVIIVQSENERLGNRRQSASFLFRQFVYLLQVGEIFRMHVNPPSLG